MVAVCTRKMAERSQRHERRNVDARRVEREAKETGPSPATSRNWIPRKMSLNVLLPQRLQTRAQPTDTLTPAS